MGNFTAQMGRNARDEWSPPIILPFHKLIDDAISQFFTELENDKVTKELKGGQVDGWLDDIVNLLSMQGFTLYIYYDDRIIPDDALEHMVNRGFSVWKHRDGVTALLMSQLQPLKLSLMQDGFYQYVFF